MAPLDGRAILVTGAAGSVGSAVVRRLAGNGARVRAMVRHSSPPTDADIDIVTADLAHRAALDAAVDGIELAVHCAATLAADKALCRVTNIDGTQNLIEALIAARCTRVVHLSSVSVYDPRFGWEFDEGSATWRDDTSPYGYSKAESEHIVLNAAQRGLEAVVLRPVAVLSMHPHSFWGPRALDRARQTDAPIFGCVDLPFVHVDNLVEAIVLALCTRAAAGRVYDVIDGYGATAAYLDAIAAATGRPAPPLPLDAPSMRFRGERIRNELGYDPPARFDEFLQALRAWR
jgi:nucleoside-diphosphate-sugar epimerase